MPAATDAIDDRGSPAPMWAWAAVAALVAGYLWLHGRHGFVSVGDEGIYLYDGWRWATAGRVPYLDVFLAHPPLRVAIAAAVVGVGLPLVAAKWVAIGATAATAALVADAAALVAATPTSASGAVPRSTSAAQRTPAAIAAMAAATAWLASPLVMQTGGYALGPDIATAAMIAAVSAGLRGRWALAGAAMAVGVLQALYAAVALPLVILLAWRAASRRAALTRLALGLSPAPAVLVAAHVASDGAATAQILGFQLAKIAAAAATPWPWAKISAELAEHMAFGLVAIAATLWIVRRGQPRAPTLAIGAWAALAIVLGYRSFAPYYLVGPVALLAVTIGAGIGGAATDTRRGRLLAWAGAGALLLQLAPTAGAAVARRASQPLVDAELDVVAGRLRARPPPSRLLFGDSSLAPVLSLRTGWPLARDLVDTNDKRFAAGTITAEAVIAVLQRDRPGLVMVPHHGVFRVAPLRAWIEANYRAVFWHRAVALGYDVVYLLPADQVERGPR